VHSLYTSVASVLTPASPYARDIGHLFWTTFWISMVILIFVSAFVIYNLIRFRDRGQGGLPPQTHGNTAVEITWTVIPLVILVVLFVLTVQTMAAVSPSAKTKADAVKLDVVAHQWWWEFHYPGSDVTTANELHIPVGRTILIDLTSVDVIHDFWVPELGRKMDAVPGHPNTMVIQADKPGVYLGACAEFCGAGHAWMRIRVVAQSEADYQSWLATQAKPHAQPTTALQTAGQGLFVDLTCSSCHTLTGSGAPASKDVGPDLTHLADRETLAAGVIANTPENLKQWLTDPNSIKPGSYMPNLHLSSRQLDALVAYLEEQP